MAALLPLISKLPANTKVMKLPPIPLRNVFDEHQISCEHQLTKKEGNYDGNRSFEECD
jgi:hypothetical protein